MTVKRYLRVADSPNYQYSVECQWFVGETLKEAVFLVDNLDSVDATP